MWKITSGVKWKTYLSFHPLNPSDDKSLQRSHSNFRLLPYWSLPSVKLSSLHRLDYHLPPPAPTSSGPLGLIDITQSRDRRGETRHGGGCNIRSSTRFFIRGVCHALQMVTNALTAKTMLIKYLKNDVVSVGKRTRVAHAICVSVGAACVVQIHIQCAV